MTTKNYVALFRGLGYPTAYLAFQNKYKDNLKGTTSFKKNGKELFVDYYDINNTAVIVGWSGKEFGLKNKEPANLKIIGLEKNIKKIEKELPLKEIKLREVII